MNPSESNYKLPKQDKLRLRTLVNDLFSHGRKIYAYPLRLSWQIHDEADLEQKFKYGVPDGIGNIQMMITVPKKKRRHAVDRVLMRRRIREAYRLNRSDLMQTVAKLPQIRTLSLAFIYLSDENIEYHEVERQMRILLAKLEEKLHPTRSIDSDCHKNV